MFMLVEVPDPVWNTSRGNSWSHWPAATSSAASWMAAATRLSITLRRAFSNAAAPLMAASAEINDRSTVRPEIGKFSIARWVWACHLASLGTLTSPMESCSMR